MQKKVSIIIPVYNIEKYVERCLNSVKRQTYQNFEAIIVDDGSTDSSLSICQNFAKKDARFKVFHQKNLGLSAARNFGIKKATGEFLAFLDGDDEILPEFLKVLADAAESQQAEIAVCGFFEVYPNNKQKLLTEKAIKKEAEKVSKRGVLAQKKNLEVKTSSEKIVRSGTEATIRLLIFQNNLEIVIWNKLYRRELFDRVQFPVGKICEDNLTTYKLLAKAKKVAYIDRALYKYYRRENSITKKTKQLVFCKMRELAAKEAIALNIDSAELAEAARYSLLLAYLKYIDFSLSGKIEKKYFKIYREKILKEKSEFLKLRFLDRKRKFYIKLLNIFGGFFYVLFRKIRHEKIN